MDVLKFMKERRRMCDYYSRCFECPRADEQNCNIEEMSDEELKNFVNTVEQWSKEHPQKTRQMDFMEKFPNAMICDNGTPKACCKHLGYTMDCPTRSSCKECWNKPMEEEDK